MNKCRCGAEYVKYTSLQNRCPKCLAERVRKAREKKERKEHREAKERVKPRSAWLTSAQTACNQYIRERDKEYGCISCDKGPDWGGQWHSGHYRPAGNNPAIRYHPFNVHKQCSVCNNHKSGNLVDYRENLVGKIGIDAVEWLETQNQPYKWETEDLKEIKAYFKEQLKLLK